MAARQLADSISPLVTERMGLALRLPLARAMNERALRLEERRLSEVPTDTIRPLPGRDRLFECYRTSLEEALLSHQKDLKFMDPNVCYHINMSEHLCRRYLDKVQKSTEKYKTTADSSGPKYWTTNDLTICEGTPPEVVASIKSLAASHSECFLQRSDQLPHAIRNLDGSDYVHRLNFKANYRPVRCPPPKMPPTSAKYKCLEALAREQLDSGLIVECNRGKAGDMCEWGSRPLLVAKFGLDKERDGIPDSLRFCIDYSRCNKQINLATPMVPDVEGELNRVQGHRWYIQIDFAKAYWSFLLDRESSMASAVWLPYKGTWRLFRSTRMVMGQINSAMVMQAHYFKILSTLSPETREHVSQMADDAVIFGDTYSEVLDAFEKMLGACKKHRISIPLRK